jgi:thiol-disulfide isomerase/thioredoxin
MTKDVKFTLYYANWCGHCINFKPEWQKIKTELNSELQSAGINTHVKFDEYEQGANPDKINAAGVAGFPTIKVSMNGHDSDYYGPRSKEGFVDFISSKMSASKPSQRNKRGGGGNSCNIKNGQCGGSKNNNEDDIYYHKYMKYKKKYLDAKNKL